MNCDKIKATIAKNQYENARKLSVCIDSLIASRAYIFHFISIFILLTRRKATEALHWLSNNPVLLPKMQRYCCLVEIFLCSFLVLWRVKFRTACQAGESAVKSLSQNHNRRREMVLN